jgi:ABC-type transport system substrate-binding protein
LAFVNASPGHEEELEEAGMTTWISSSTKPSRTPTSQVPGHRLFGFLVALAALLVLLASGAAAPARGSSTAAPNTLRISLFAGIENLDPARAYYSIDWQLLNAVCAKLVTFPDRPAPEGFTVQPEVAAAMPTVSADRKTYTFKIRDDFTLSSGEKVTAQTFKAAIDRVASPNVGSPLASFLGDIVGFDAVNNGTASSVSGVVASGDTLTITLTRPVGHFLELLALPFTCAIPVDTPKSPVVSSFPSAGPYYIDSYVPNQSIVLKRNPNYSGSRPRYFDEIDYTLGVQPDQAYLQVLNGQLDYPADGLPATAYEPLWAQYGPGSAAAAQGRQRYFVNPTQIIDFLALNTTAGRPLANVKLRQAVNYALDRAAIAAIRGDHAATPTAQYLPAAIPGFRDETIYPLDGPDLATAQALVAASGVPPPVPIVLYASSSTFAQNQARLVAAELEAVGFSVDLQSFASGLLTKCGTKGEPFDICAIGWAAEYPDPYAFLQLFDGRTIQDVQNNNISYFDDPAFNAKLDAAAALSGEARYAAFGDLDVELARDSAPWAALDYRNNRELFSDRIGGQVYQPAYASMDLATLYVRPGISLDDVRLGEGNSGSASALFTVSLSSVEQSPVTVDFATADETATAGSDYTATQGTATIPAGERQTTISVPVSGDTSTEPDETFTLAVSNPSSGTIIGATGRATIANDDARDTTPPVTTMSSGPPILSTNRTPSFSFSADESASFECRIDSGSWVPCSSPYTSAPLADGAHSFQVRATDAAGNVGAAASVSFTVDTTAPETTIDSGPTGTTDTTPTFSFSASEAGASFQCSLDGAAFAACSSPYTTAVLAIGTHSFEVRALDVLGNADPSPAARSFTVRSARASLAIVSSAVTVTKTRLAAVKLHCGTQVRCGGTLRLTATVSGKLVGSRLRSVLVKLGSAGFSIAAGRTATVKVRLPVAGYKLLVRVRRLPVKAQIGYRQPAGGSTTATRTITLRAPAKP